MRVAIGAPWKQVNNITASGLAVVYEMTSEKKWDQIGLAVGTDDGPSGIQQVGYSIDIVNDYLLVGVPFRDVRRGQAILLKFDEAQRVWESLETDALRGMGPNEDFGYALTMTIDEGMNDRLTIAVTSIILDQEGAVDVFSNRP